MTKILSKIYKKGSGLILEDEDILEFEEELLNNQNKKLKKHYLKSDAKAFVHKLLKTFRS